MKRIYDPKYLKAYYILNGDTTPDGKIKDYSGHENHGQVEGTAKYITDSVGNQAFEFDGSTFINLGMEDFNATNGITIIGRFFNVSDSYVPYVCKPSDDGIYTIFSIYLYNKTVAIYGTENGNYRGFINIPTKIINDAQTHDYMCTYDGLGTWKIYIDGKLEYSEVKTSSVLDQNNKAWILGSQLQSADAIRRYYDGAMSHCLIYNTPLTLEEYKEIRKSFNSTPNALKTIEPALLLSNNIDALNSSVHWSDFDIYFDYYPKKDPGYVHLISLPYANGFMEGAHITLDSGHIRVWYCDDVGEIQDSSIPIILNKNNVIHVHYKNGYSKIGVNSIYTSLERKRSCNSSISSPLKLLSTMINNSQPYSDHLIKNLRVFLDGTLFGAWKLANKNNCIDLSGNGRTLLTAGTAENTSVPGTSFNTILKGLKVNEPKDNDLIFSTTDGITDTTGRCTLEQIGDIKTGRYIESNSTSIPYVKFDLGYSLNQMSFTYVAIILPSDLSTNPQTIFNKIGPNGTYVPNEGLTIHNYLNKGRMESRFIDNSKDPTYKSYLDPSYLIKNNENSILHCTYDIESNILCHYHNGILITSFNPDWPQNQDSTVWSIGANPRNETTYLPRDPFLGKIFRVEIYKSYKDQNWITHDYKRLQSTV